MSTIQKSETQRQKRRYTMSAAALAARSAGGRATARVRPPQPRQWATVVVPLATRATAEDLRAPGEPLWRPIARALESAKNLKNREKTDPSA
jgi:hypothetical protein